MGFGFLGRWGGKPTSKKKGPDNNEKIPLFLPAYIYKFWAKS